MFNHARFRWALGGLLGNPGMPFEWDPYGIPLSELLQRAFLFENGKLRGLPSRRRALVTALAMLETNLVPREGKETLFLTCAEYARKHGEYDAVKVELERAAAQLTSIGLLAPVTMEAIETKAAALARALVDDIVAKKR